MLVGKPIAIPGLEQKHLNPFPSKKKWTEWREALNSGPHILRKREVEGREREKLFQEETISVASKAVPRLEVGLVLQRPIR